MLQLKPPKRSGTLKIALIYYFRQKARISYGRITHDTKPNYPRIKQKWIPIGFVYLYDGQSKIESEDIEDARLYLNGKPLVKTPMLSISK